LFNFILINIFNQNFTYGLASGDSNSYFYSITTYAEQYGILEVDLNCYLISNYEIDVESNNDWNVSETLKVSASYIAEKTEGAVDYLGDNILGNGAYRSLKARVSSYTRLIQNLFSSFTTSFEVREQNKLNAKDNERKNHNRLKYLNESSTVSSLENEAKKAKDHVSNLIIELNHFLSRNEVYLKKNILDKTEDGIQKNRPDVVRQELTHFQRPIFDPFPSQYVREHVLGKKDKIA
jgi:hypothetical protein